VYAFFAYRLARREEVEDLTQMTFERAVRAWGRYDPTRASVGTWLIAIAQNLFIDHLRRNRSGRETSITPDDVATPTAAGPEQALGTGPELASALECLNDREREVIALRFGGDLGGPEIAELLGLSLANVQQIMSRSLRRLRAELEPSAGRVPSG
jgi:RNA polymerase sigma factor (sigma-70 family)